MPRTNKVYLFVLTILLVELITGCSTTTNQTNNEKAVELLNVSYDPTREFYKEFNDAFAAQWKEEKDEVVTIKQSHGGSGSQGRSIIDGIEADVATLALAYDIDEIHLKRGFLPADWQERLPNNSTPYTSTIVFLVHKGNPKNIQDWDDLIQDDVSVITPNPKTSGGARWNYLAAWGYADKQFAGDEKKIKQFMEKLFGNVEVLDSGARGATTTFVERGIGDVLIAWENEALLSLEEFDENQFEIVVPSMSILAEPPVAVIDKVVEKKGTEEVAQAYLEFLYSETGQQLAAKHYYRPRNKEILKKHADRFPELELLTIDEAFGGWQKAQVTHFSDGGTFDDIYTK